MKKIELLNKYLASLEVAVNKLHNLHWNVVGINFKPVHLLTEELYERFFDNADEVAEAIRMNGKIPFVLAEDFVKNSFIKEVPGKEVKDVECLKIILADLKLFLKNATEIKDVLDKESDYATSAIFDGYIQSFLKDIWFIESMLK